MVDYTSTQNGNWNDSATWGGGGTPGDGDKATINHLVAVTVNQVVGDGTTPGTDGGSQLVVNNGKLTINEDVDLELKGDLRADNDITLEAGARLRFNTAADARYAHSQGGVNAALYCNGTAAKPCAVEAIGAGRFIHRILTWEGAGSCRIVAYHTTFSRYGSETSEYGISYYVNGTDGDLYPWLCHDCVFDDGYGIAPVTLLNDDHSPTTGKIEFLRCKFTNGNTPVGIDAFYRNIRATSFPGMDASFKYCDIDVTVGFLHPDDWTTEDSVLRQGFIRFDNDNYTNGAMGPIERTFIRLPSDSGTSILYGDVFRDCAIVSDTNDNNPHFLNVGGGTGDVLLERCLFWTTSTAASSEGDGVLAQAPDSGTQGDNQITFKNCIILPNGNGPNVADSHSMTAVTLLNTVSNMSVHLEGNTFYVGNNFGALNTGETSPTVAGNVQYMRSNLFVGHVGLTAKKADDLSNTVNGTVVVGAFDYNGSWRIPKIDGGPGNGYDGYLDGGGSPLSMGANDVDDEDPEFVDYTRNDITWAGSLTAAMDRCSFEDSNYAISDLHDHVREGWTPTNTAFKAAGDPAMGSPDIGAVEVSTTPTIPDPPTSIDVQTVSANKVMQHQSPYHFRLALHSWSKGISLVDGSAQTYQLGAVLDAPSKDLSDRPPGLVSLDLGATDAFASGESLQIVLEVFRSGNMVTVYDATVTDSELAVAGTLDVLANVTAAKDFEIFEGDVLQLTTTYTAGGGPNDPTCFVTVQLA